MLDVTTQDYSLWEEWHESQGKELEYKYFLGNQRVISTTTKPFLITEGTKIQVGEIILGKSIDIILGEYTFKINTLTYIKDSMNIPYMSGKKQLVYTIPGGKHNNFLRSWFTEIKKDSK